MPKSLTDPHSAAGTEHIPNFPHAPAGWLPSDAIVEASRDRLPLGEDHWKTIRTIQALAASIGQLTVDDLQDELEGRFERQGGIRYLYLLFPKGPVAQACRLAGLSTLFDAETSAPNSPQQNQLPEAARMRHR